MKLSEIDLKKAYRTWHEVAGHFKCFVRASNFVSLKHYPDFELLPMSDGSHALVAELVEQVQAIDLDKTLLMIDLPDDIAIQGALRLHQQRGILPVMTFKGLLHPHGLVGTQSYISHLLQGMVSISPVQKDASREGLYAFYLDSHRYGDEDPQKLQQFFNNQYELNEEDLPGAEQLKSLGYERIYYYGTETLKEDVASYLEYLVEQGIGVNQVRVGGTS